MREVEWGYTSFYESYFILLIEFYSFLIVFLLNIVDYQIDERLQKLISSGGF